MLSCSSTWVLNITHNLISDKVTDIYLKCSGYILCHLENSLAGLWYVF